MTDEQQETLNQLRKDGHAVVIFNADELRGATAGDVEILLAIHGCDVIDSLATVKREGWVNVYRMHDGHSCVVYKTKQEAISCAGMYAIATVRIEWEEEE